MGTTASRLVGDSVAMMPLMTPRVRVASPTNWSKPSLSKIAHHKFRAPISHIGPSRGCGSSRMTSTSRVLHTYMALVASAALNVLRDFSYASLHPALSSWLPRPHTQSALHLLVVRRFADTVGIAQGARELSPASPAGGYDPFFGASMVGPYGGPGAQFCSMF